MEAVLSRKISPRSAVLEFILFEALSAGEI